MLCVIRPGRRVVTQVHLAHRAKKALQTFRNQRLHLVQGHPEPVSSPALKRALWDDEQTACFWAREPVRGLGAETSDDDLLDRYEAAHLVDIDPETWRRYQTHSMVDPPPPAPEPAPGPGGEEIDEPHWRRGELTRWLASRAGQGVGGGRPTEDVADQAARLVQSDPHITRQEAAAALGLGHETAANALSAARADAVARLWEQEPQLAAADLVERLGYRLPAAQRAVEVCAARARAAVAEPYITGTVQEWEVAGCGVTRATVRVRPGATVAAEVRLERAQPGGARHVVWDERYGWRTAPTGGDLFQPEATPPTGRGVRYLSRTQLAPPAGEVLATLQDARRGTRRPTFHRTVEEDLATHLPEAARASS